MNVSDEIKKVIEKIKSDDSNIKPPGTDYHDFYKILEEIILIMGNKAQCNDVLYALDVELIDYLLDFIVTYFEKMYFLGSEYQQFISWLEATGYFCNLCSFYRQLYLKVDIERSSLHVLAFVYMMRLNKYVFERPGLSHMQSHIQNYNWTWLAKLEKNDQINKIICNYILKIPRILNKDFKILLRNNVFNKSNGRSYYSDPILIFFFNNETNFLIFNEYDELLKSRNSISFCPRTIAFGLRCFNYDQLNVLQITNCINSKYFIKCLTQNNTIFFLSTRNIREYWDEKISFNLNYWISTFPEIINIINKNVYNYRHAFIFLTYFSITNLCHEGTKLIITKLFNKNNLNFISKQNIFATIVEIFDSPVKINILFIEEFTKLKVADDEYIYTILYSGLYHQYVKDHVFVHYCAIGRPQNEQFVWYDIHVGGTGLVKPFSAPEISIIGLPKQQIRKTICFQHFLNKYKINDDHLKCIQKLKKKLEHSTKSDLAFKLLGEISSTKKSSSSKQFLLGLI